MENTPLTDALRRVRVLATAGRLTDLSDGALLDHYVMGADDAAFAELVERHGHMVHGVCSRIVRNGHDAEDACQATFLVLARQAARIRKQPSVASWLHGVARRVSLTLLRDRVARQRRERGLTTPEAAAEPPELSWSEVQVLLDEELARLPEQVRAPLILCYLEGKTRDEAAAALGHTQGRLHGLLQRGRILLQERLTRRGVSARGGFLDAGMSPALPATLAGRIILGACGQELATTQATLIANEVLQAMFYAKLKIAALWAAACVVVLGVLVGVGLARQPLPPPVSAPVPQPPADPKPAPLEFRKVLTMPAAKENDFRHAALAVSNEQKSVWSRNLTITDQADPKATTSGLHLWTLTPDQPTRTRLGDSTTFGFIPNSTLGYAVHWGPGVVLYDTRSHTKVGEPLPHELREDTMPRPAVRPDGTVLVTRSKLAELTFWDVKTRQPLGPPVAQRGIVYHLEFSADGKWLFSENARSELHVWDARTGKPVAGPFRQDAAGRPAYSPTAQQLVTFENGKEREAVIRSSKDWGVVQRVPLGGLGREARWLDDTHLLIVGHEPEQPEGRPIPYGRNLLQVVTLNGQKAEVATVGRGLRWIPAVSVAADGKHFVASLAGGEVRCWKLGAAEPLWTKGGGRTAECGAGDWAVLTGNGVAVAYSVTAGKELWRQDKVDDVRVQGSDIWVFSPKGVEVWRVGVAR